MTDGKVGVEMMWNSRRDSEVLMDGWRGEQMGDDAKTAVRWRSKMAERCGTGYSTEMMQR